MKFQNEAYQIMKNDIFFTDDEIELSEKYHNQGYVIHNVKNKEALEWIRNLFISLIRENLAIKKNIPDHDLFNLIHTELSVSQLNDFRLDMISQMNSTKGFKKRYYQIAKPYLDIIVGNELSMQSKINLSIQLPDDDSSLLATHADTWSGDSPFEVVVWLPLVDCYNTKSMYILPPSKNIELNRNFKKISEGNSKDLFKAIEQDVQWIDINYGEVMIFNQSLPHGNQINREGETRWSMNCRFKSVFSPYGDKKIGEFFEPITIRPASVSALNYQHPEVT